MLKGAKGKTDDWRVPLSDPSLTIIEEAKRHERNGLLFPNVSGRGVISDASMSRLMERRQLAFRPHGFRASFKTWAAETDQRRDIAELCLGHKIYGSVKASYLRTDFLDERKELMEAWARNVT
jgi:integrase